MQLAFGLWIFTDSLASCVAVPRTGTLRRVASCETGSFALSPLPDAFVMLIGKLCAGTLFSAMKLSRRLTLGILIAVACLIGCLFVVTRHRTPTYQGKTTAEWLREFAVARARYQKPAQMPGGQTAWYYDEGSAWNDPTAQALRALGTNAALYLGRRIDRSTSPLSQSYDRAYFKLSPALRRALPAPLVSEDDLIAAALKVLGPEAKPAVPSLIRAIGQGTMFQSFIFLSCLRGLPYRTEDLDPILQKLVDRNDLAGAVNVIAQLHTHTKTAAITLKNALTDTNRLVTAAAWNEAPHFEQQADMLLPVLSATLVQEGADPLPALSVLYAFGDRASPALPGLLRTLEHTNEEVRYQTARVLEAMGTNAQSAWSALCRATNDPSIMVQRSSARALSNLAATPTQY
jgi:hypothetical protein